MSTQSLGTVTLEYIDAGVDLRSAGSMQTSIQWGGVFEMAWRSACICYCWEGGQGGRRRKGSEDVVSIDPGYPWEIGSSTPSFHRRYQNLWVCTSADSAFLNMDWRLFLKLVLGHMDHRSNLKPQPYNCFGWSVTQFGGGSVFLLDLPEDLINTISCKVLLKKTGRRSDFPAAKHLPRPLGNPAKKR